VRRASITRLLAMKLRDGLLGAIYVLAPHCERARSGAHDCHFPPPVCSLAPADTLNIIEPFNGLTNAPNDLTGKCATC
jgi:hypothetical protein